MGNEIINKHITVAVGENNALEAIAIRSVLEYYGFLVHTIYVGRPNDFLELLRNNTITQVSGYLILCFHGHEGKIVMPVLSDEVYNEGEPKGNLNTDSIRKYAKFNRQVILSTACGLGSKEMADAFLSSNASAYIAPSGYVEGNASLIFITKLFYLLSKGQTINDAFRNAQNIDDETMLFRFF